MAFIKMALAEVKEAVAVPEGEYDLRIDSAEVVDSKNQEKGGQNIKALILIEDAAYPKAAPITHYISLPNDKDDARAIEFKMLQAKRFLACFNIPFDENGFDPDDFPGATGRSLVTQSEMLNKEGKGTGEMRNELRLPRLREEAEEKAEKSSGARRRR